MLHNHYDASCPYHKLNLWYGPISFFLYFFLYYFIYLFLYMYLLKRNICKAKIKNTRKEMKNWKSYHYVLYINYLRRKNNSSFPVINVSILIFFTNHYSLFTIVSIPFISFFNMYISYLLLPFNANRKSYNKIKKLIMWLVIQRACAIQFYRNARV